MGAVIPCLVIACAGSGDEDKSNDDPNGTQGYGNWFCQDDGSACSCRALPRSRMAAGSDEVDQCGDYDCCVFSDEATEDAEATCSCFSTDATCEQEVATRPGSEVVATCPPGAQQPEIACAAEGENCRSDYLSQNDLDGCCDGTLCRPDGNGVPVCQTASAEDLALHDRCEAWVDSRGTNFDLYDSSIEPMALSTSHGLLPLDEVGLSMFGTGPGGCLNEFTLRLGDGVCGLDLTGEVVDGSLTVTDASGSLLGCPDYTGSSTEASFDSAPPMVSDFSFEGLSCDAGLVFESYCIAGAFIFTLGGAAGALTFEPQTLTVEVVTCQTGDPAGACPTNG